MVSKVSEIKVNDIAEYLRLDADNVELNQLTTLLNIAKNYCANYTGIPITSEEEGTETLDDFPDLVIAIYVLCQDMYDNRTMYVDSGNTNKVVQTILDMHSRNLL